MIRGKELLLMGSKVPASGRLRHGERLERVIWFWYEGTSWTSNMAESSNRGGWDQNWWLE